MRFDAARPREFDLEPFAADFQDRPLRLKLPGPLTSWRAPYVVKEWRQ